MTGWPGRLFLYRVKVHWLFLCMGYKQQLSAPSRRNKNVFEKPAPPPRLWREKIYTAMRPQPYRAYVTLQLPSEAGALPRRQQPTAACVSHLLPPSPPPPFFVRWRVFAFAYPRGKKAGGSRCGRRRELRADPVYTHHPTLQVMFAPCLERCLPGR